MSLDENLVKLLEYRGQIPSENRNEVIFVLKEYFRKFIVLQGKKKNMSVDALICDIREFGSTCFGADLVSSDIDLIFLGPNIITQEDFYSKFVHRLFSLFLTID
jgi:poly(A) polymerase Pap1